MTNNDWHAIKPNQTKLSYASHCHSTCDAEILGSVALPGDCDNVKQVVAV